MAEFRIASVEARTEPVGEVAIYHKFAFAIGTAQQPEQVAARLLKEGVALAAVASMGDVLVPKHFDDLVAQLAFLEKLGELLERGDKKAVAGLGLRHPLSAARAWSAMRASSKRTADATLNESDGGAELDDGVASDPLTKIRSAYMEAAALEGFCSLLDQQHVRPAVLAAEPWCRVGLPSLEVTTSAGVLANIDVSLLVHRAGAAVMTLCQRLDPGATPSEVNYASFASTETIVETVIDERIMELAAEATESVLGEGERQHGPHRPLIRFRHPDDPTSLARLCEFYRDAIVLASTGAKPNPIHNEYRVIPLTSLRGLPDDRHAELGPLLALHYLTSDLDTAGYSYPMERVQQRSASPKATVFVTDACLVHVFNDSCLRHFEETYGSVSKVPPEEWSHFEFSVGLAIDLALCRQEIVESHARSVRSSATVAELRDLNRSLLANFQEVTGDRYFVAGELNEIETTYLDAVGFNARRDNTLEQQRQADNLLASIDADRSARSSSRLQATVLVLTVLLGIIAPLAALLTLEDADERFPAIYDHDFTTWASNLVLATSALMVAMLVLMAAFWAFRRTRSRRRA